MRKGQTEILTVIITIIVGVAVAIPILSAIISKATTVYSVSNESLGTISSVPTVVQTTHYPVVPDSETITLSNTTTSVTLTRGTDYTVVDYNKGEFNITTLKGLTGTVTASIDYKWHYDTYINSPIERSLISMIPLFVAIAILVFVVVLVR